MRIAQLIDGLKMGGAEKLQVTMAAAAQAHGADLTVINLLLKSERTLEPEITAHGVRVLHVPTKGLWDLKAIWQLARLLREERFDVLHTQLDYANIMGALAGRLAGVPVVGTLHSSALHPGHKAWVHRAETWALRYGMKKVVAVGHVVADAHRARLGNQSLAIIPNAVPAPEKLTTAEREAVRQEICGASDRPIVISVGRLAVVKGYFDLLEAFAVVQKQVPDAFLAIVGGGRLHEALAQQIEALALTHNVRLLGLRSDVPRLLAASDLYVCSSHWEGLPLSILEAMMAGLPIVATEVGDIPRVVVEGTGKLVPPLAPLLLANGLHALLINPQKRKAFGKRAQEHVMRHHSIDAWFTQLQTLYRDVSMSTKERALMTHDTSVATN